MQNSPFDTASQSRSRIRTAALDDSLLEDGVRNLAVEPETRAVIRTSSVYQTEAEKGVAGYPGQAVRIAMNFDNDGALPDPDGVGVAGRSKRGVNYCQIYICVNPDTGCIDKATFCARGSLGMIASASAAAHLCEGRTPLAALDATTAKQIHACMGGELPRGGAMGPLIAAEAVRAAVGDYLLAQGAGVEELDQVCPCDTASMGCLMSIQCSLRESRIELMLERYRSSKAR